MGKSSAPPPPDYVGAANATAQGNLQAARAATDANRVNQVTPYGNLTYTQNTANTFDAAGYNAAMNAWNSSHPSGGNLGFFGAMMGSSPGSGAPQISDFMHPDSGWTATQTLSPQQQAIYDQQTKLNSGLLGDAQSGLDYASNVITHPGVNMNSLPQMPINPGESYTDAYNRWMQPNWDRQQEMTDASLANQGITQGSAAWQNAQRDLHDQINRDQLAGVTQGMQTGLNANNQAFNQQAYNQMQPINVINALRTGTQVQTPNFVNAPQQGQTAGPDLLSAVNGNYQAQLGNVNAQNAQAANTAGTVGTVATAAAVLF